ncbi:hypothetical protein RKD18_006102 [Streptomyces phaeoluteigriseus]
MTGDADGAPAVGEAVHDSARGRVGRVMDHVGPYVQLRPLTGGREWDADPRHLRPLTRAELLSALVAEANARSRRAPSQEPPPPSRASCSTVPSVTHVQGGTVQQPKAALAERIAERRWGGDDPRALVGEMRRSVLLVPVADGGLWSVRSGGVRWICGFTDEDALARFALHHGPGDQPMEYAALLGARIVDEIVPALGEPAGLAVDIATEDGSMFFPPVVGIVPEAAAVDAGEAEEGARS